MNNRILGSIGEKIALDYLLKNGFTILERNFRYGKLGEIDIIASEKEYICFIEIKTRTGDFYGKPMEAVNYKKRQKIRTLAWIYLKQKGISNANMRFDIVEVTGKRGVDSFILKCIDLLRNAF